MKLKINGVVVVEGDEVTVSNTADLVKVNEVYARARSLLDKYEDITHIDVQRIIKETP